jgi:hypothetical protein
LFGPFPHRRRRFATDRRRCRRTSLVLSSLSLSAAVVFGVALRRHSGWNPWSSSSEPGGAVAKSSLPRFLSWDSWAHIPQQRGGAPGWSTPSCWRRLEVGPRGGGGGGIRTKVNRHVVDGGL